LCGFRPKSRYFAKIPAAGCRRPAKCPTILEPPFRISPKLKMYTIIYKTIQNFTIRYIILKIVLFLKFRVELLVCDIVFLSLSNLSFVSFFVLVQ
jgi:hypothetical protein